MSAKGTTPQQIIDLYATSASLSDVAGGIDRADSSIGYTRLTTP